MFSTDGCVSAAVEVTLMFMQYDQTLKMITEGKINLPRFNVQIKYLCEESEYLCIEILVNSCILVL